MAKRRPRADNKKIEVDWKRVQDMLRSHISGEHIALILGISYDTLERRCKQDHDVKYKEYALKFKTVGKQLLRQKQMEIAMKGNVTMLIFLGKQYLDQSDKVSNDIDVNTPIKVTHQMVFDLINKKK